MSTTVATENISDLGSLAKQPARAVLGYGLGDFANNLAFSMGTSFLLYYLTDVAGVTAAAVGTMFLVVRLWDAFTDLFAGRLVAGETGIRAIDFHCAADAPGRECPSNPLLRRAIWSQKLYFGGSETASRAAGYMEGALEAAQRIARDVLRATGFVTAAAATSSLGSKTTKAAGYPTRTVKIIVPFAPVWSKCP